MKTTEALQIIEEKQKAICFVGQSVIGRKAPKFSAEVIDAVKSLTEEMVHSLGKIKQEIYRFMQDNNKLEIKCAYSIDSPISGAHEVGEIKGAQHKLLTKLSEIKVELKKVESEALISGDNRRFKPTSVFNEEIKKFSTGVDKFSELILSFKHEGIADAEKTEEISIDEKKNSTESTISEPEDSLTKEEEVLKHECTQSDLDNNPELVDAGVKVGDIIEIPKEETQDNASESHVS